MTPPILPFSIGLAGRRHNSINTTVLHYDLSLVSLITNRPNSNVSQYNNANQQKENELKFE